MRVTVVVLKNQFEPTPVDIEMDRFTHVSGWQDRDQVAQFQRVWLYADDDIAIAVAATLRRRRPSDMVEPLAPLSSSLPTICAADPLDVASKGPFQVARKRATLGK